MILGYWKINLNHLNFPTSAFDFHWFIFFQKYIALAANSVSNKTY